MAAGRADHRVGMAAGEGEGMSGWMDGWMDRGLSDGRRLRGGLHAAACVDVCAMPVCVANETDCRRTSRQEISCGPATVRV